MDSQQLFDKKLKGWIDSVKRAIDKELSENPKKYRENFDKIKSALTIFSPIAEHLPIDQASWIYGEDKIASHSSNIQIIMEFLTQAIYMEAGHLWPAANHSARCALEHTFWTIWQIAYPTKSNTRIGGPDQAKFKEMKDAVFELPHFKLLKNMFSFSGDGGQTKVLIDKITEVYGHLSYYVHTSNIHIELRGKRPHITHDLGTNPKAEKDTEENISDALILIVILLSIACKEHIDKGMWDKLEEITSIKIKEIISGAT